MAEASKLTRRLSSQDASFLYNETPNGPLHVGLLQTFEGEIEFDRLIEHLERRIHLLPRYRQRLVFAPFNLAHATLEDDPEFALRNHLKLHTLESGAGDAELAAAAMRANEPALERSRPLWELHLFQRLEGGRSALLWKIHHCIVDGVSALQLIAIAMDLRPDAPAPPPASEPWTPASLPDKSRSLLDAAIALVQSRLDEVREAGKLLSAPADLAERSAAMASAAAQMFQMMSRPVVPAPWNLGLVGRARSLAWLRVSFGDLRAIRSALGGTVNDVVLSILSEGAARYLKHHEVASGGLPLRIGCPVNVRRDSEAGAMGNRVSMMFPELAATPMDPIERYRSVVRETERIKAAREPQGMDLLTAAADSVAPGLQDLSSKLTNTAIEAATRLSEFTGGMARMIVGPPMGINFVATNVPGAQVPMYLAGRRMLDFIGLVPLAGTLGYGVAIVSYNQSLFFATVAEPRLMPDVEFMKSCIAGAFEDLRAAAQSVMPVEERLIRTLGQALKRDSAVAAD
ncbi:MAG TPA: wax ester/triacylglycerol synthase family O-acyltransferase [Candidatus Binataceae bacterium]|nr:wax ester/triacylglycerol synthase family O-acyltransferase [Candidatus Binataceae bacterium]